MEVERSTIVITVGGIDVTERVVFGQTNFQAVAGAQPGSCTVTLRGPLADLPDRIAAAEGQYQIYGDFTPGSDQICLFVDGVRMWWGYLFVLEQGYVFPDDPEAKIVLHGVDLNILFDKLFMYNHTNPTWYPDGGGTYQRQKVTDDFGTVSGYVVAVPSGTMDKDYIQTMMADFDLDLISPTIRYGQPPFPPSDCKIIPVSTITAAVDGAVWTPPSAGTTLRAFFQDVSANIIRSQPGSAIWYIDPEGYIVWDDVDRMGAPFQVGDTNSDGIVPVKNLSVTTDVSRLKNDVLIFTGTLDPSPQSTQEFLQYVHKVNNPSVNLFGRFQYSEVMGSDWLAGMINARAKKILNQEGTPAMRAEFTIYKPGLYPGFNVTIWSDEHTFVVYDPTFGLQYRDYIYIPIRSVTMSFPTPDIVEYRVLCSFDTQDPWGLLLALKRPATRGLVQPNFNVIDRTQDLTYVEGSPMTLVKEYPVHLGGGYWQTTYAYIRGSLTVVTHGRRLTGTADPGMTPSANPFNNGIAGFIEVDPDKGRFVCRSSVGWGMPDHLYVEYHIWHNLDSNAI